MALDLYFKMPEDPYFLYEETEVEDGLDEFLNQVEMILTTRKGDVLGVPDFGANLDDYLWSTRLSNVQIETDIRNQIETHCSELTSQFNYGVTVSFFEGRDWTDTMLVDITIDGTKALGIAVRP